MASAVATDSNDVVVNEESSRARMERRKSSLARGESLDEEMAKFLEQIHEGDFATAAAMAAADAAAAAATDGQAPTTGEFFKVLIAVDGGHWSWYAFEWYFKNLHRSDNEVICYHMLEKPVVREDEYCGTVDAMLKGCASNEHDLCHEYMKKLEEQKVNGRMLSLYSGLGHGESIVDAAKKEKVDLVVVGTRGGKGAVRRTLMGSVSDYVLHNAHCPVVVACHDRPRRRSSRLSSGHSISED